MNVELLHNIKKVIGDYIKTYPPKNLPDVVRVPYLPKVHTRNYKKIKEKI